MTTLEHIASILDHHGISHTRLTPEMLLTGFATGRYRDANGRAGVPICVSVQEGGAYVRLEVPWAYKAPAGHPHQAAALQALLIAAGRSKMLRFCLDPEDGEVRASICLPLMDAELGARQFLRALTAIPDLLDGHDALIRAALETGRVEPPPADAAGLLDALQALAALAGGSSRPPAKPGPATFTVNGGAPRGGTLPPGIN